MDFHNRAAEALQMLNLSPIPEISEVELTSVLEHLSGLSDLTGELTDRNVEDILREAEELLEMPSSNKTSPDNSKSLAKPNGKNGNENRNEDENENDDDNGGDNDNKSNNEKETGSCYPNTDISEDIEASEEKENEVEKNVSKVATLKTNSPPKECLSARLVSPTDSTNHIKLTLDSLREFSEKIEKQKKDECNKQEDKKVITKISKVKCNENKLIKKPKNSGADLCGNQSKPLCTSNRVGVPNNKLPSNTNKSNTIVSTKGSVNGKNFVTESKSSSYVKYPFSKKLNTDRRSNASIHMKSAGDSAKGKNFRKISKSPVIRKNSNELKCPSTPGVPKSSWFPKGGTPNKAKSHFENIEIQSKRDNRQPIASLQDSLFPDNELNLEDCLDLLNNETNKHGDQVCNSKVPDACYPKIAEQILQHSKESVTVLKQELAELRSHITRGNNNKILWDGDKEEKFWTKEDVVKILKEENAKFFKEINEIKGELKNNARIEKSEEATTMILKEKQDLVETLKSEIQSLKHQLYLKNSEGSDITRLEEQFVLIKSKYEEQINKLEKENQRLKENQENHEFPEKLSSRESQSSHTPFKSDSHGEEFVSNFEQKDMMENEDSVKPLSTRSDGYVNTKPSRTESLENCRLLKSKSSLTLNSYKADNQNLQSPKKSNYSSSYRNGNSNEATEEALEIVDLEVPSDDLNQKDFILDIQKTENKENFVTKPRRAMKSKSVCDFNLANVDLVLNSLKQKKPSSEHESQLMATLRGLHSELLLKERDTKKMKNEIESLKSQLKKYTVNPIKRKVEPQRKFHVGCQTIGLGPVCPAEYKAVLFQVSKELEEENEQLKISLQALEENYNQLKTKRISDLQILQEIHEEEMAKLASKLETQTALAKHLHSLLVNR